jgi:hypothetical protein
LNCSILCDAESIKGRLSIRAGGFSFVMAELAPVIYVLKLRNRKYQVFRRGFPSKGPGMTLEQGKITLHPA